jgi:hypothetical protein
MGDSDTSAFTEQGGRLISHPTHGIDLTDMSALVMLRLYADILTALNARGIVRSRNAPAGDLSEYVTAAAYRGTLANQSKASWDVQAADGSLLQVKSRVLEPGKPPGNYSPFRSWDFHAGVFVHFDATTYEVVHALEVPVATIQGLTTVDAHVGTTARRLTVRNLLKARDAAAVVEAGGGPVSPFIDKTAEFVVEMQRLGTL